MRREIIAILRGINPDECLDITDALIDAGITYIEVPLNSPDPFTSIQKMVQHAGDRAQVGAGTVLRIEEVERLASIGSQLIVSPDCNPAIIQATKSAGMASYPGVMTPTECFTALSNGADGLKFFPGSLIGVEGVKAIKAVLPSTAKTYAVGGADAHNLRDWLAAGVTGFGIGSALYKPSMSATDVAVKAKQLVQAYDLAYEQTYKEIR